MKTSITRIGALLLAVGISIWSSQALAQTTTTVTTTKGAFTEYVPGSETMVVRSDTGAAPLRYTVSKQTTIVDESGAPVAIERIPAGSQLSVQYSGAGDHLVASHVVVQRQAAVNAPVNSVPVTEQHTTTTTSTTREMSHKEAHELKEAREHEKKAAKEAAKEDIERHKDALDKEKDKLDDDH